MKAKQTPASRTRLDRRSHGTFDLKHSGAFVFALGGLVAGHSAHAQDQQIAQSTPSALDQVIVTGTRSAGTKATDIVSPIAVISGV